MKFKLFESSEPLGARAADVFEKTAVSLDVDRQVVQGRERLRAVVVGADEALLLAVSLLVALELEGGHEAPGAPWGRIQKPMKKRKEKLFSRLIGKEILKLFSLIYFFLGF